MNLKSLQSSPLPSPIGQNFEDEDIEVHIRRLYMRHDRVSLSEGARRVLEFERRELCKAKCSVRAVSRAIAGPCKGDEASGGELSEHERKVFFGVMEMLRELLTHE